MKSLKVRDTMSTNVITFAPDDSVVHAMATLLDKGISGAPVIAEDGRAALEAVFSVYKSQATGRAVRTAALHLD